MRITDPRINALAAKVAELSTIDRVQEMPSAAGMGWVSKRLLDGATRLLHAGALRVVVELDHASSPSDLARIQQIEDRLLSVGSALLKLVEDFDRLMHQGIQ